MTKAEKFKEIFGFLPNETEDSTLRPAYCPYHYDDDNNIISDFEKCRFWKPIKHCTCLKFWDEEYDESIEKEENDELSN